MTEQQKSIEEIEKELGIDKVQPIVPSPSYAADMEEKGDALREWYEEDLQSFYKKHTERE